MEIFVKKFSDYKNKIDDCYESLIEAECVYADGLTNPKTKERFLVSRSVVREILGSKLDTSPKNVELVFNENGKPYVNGNPIYFSVSHSYDLLVIGVHDSPIGVDVECMKERNFAALAKEFGFDADDKESFYKQWTLYEAEVKMVGSTIFGHKKIEVENSYSQVMYDYMLSVVWR